MVPGNSWAKGVTLWKTSLVMPTRTPAPAAVPRLTYLRIKNYRALRDVEFRDLTPLTVLIGPNGSGKSSVLDALDFLAEAVRGNLTQAWEKRNRFAGMRTRGSEGDIEFEVEISPSINGKRIKYELSLSEENQNPVLSQEYISIEHENGFYDQIFTAWQSGTSGTIGLGYYESDLSSEEIEDISKQNNEFLRVKRIGGNQLNVGLLSVIKNQAQETARLIVSLLDSYRYIHLTDGHLKGYSDAGPREKLSPNGDNLPNVLYYLHTKHPEALEKITAQMRRWVPGLADIVTEITSDERLLLRFRDAPFEKPLPAQYMSDGTMRLAALLTLLYEPGATGLLGLEEPENELHPRLLHQLAEELGKATETRQLLVATHSPLLLDALEPEQVWILDRGPDGYTKATRTADLPHVQQMVEDGSPLGYLWTSNFFSIGDPLAPRNAATDAR